MQASGALSSCSSIKRFLHTACHTPIQKHSNPKAQEDSSRCGHCSEVLLQLSAAGTWSMALKVLTAASLQASDLSSKRRSSAFPSLQERASATSSADGGGIMLTKVACAARRRHMQLFNFSAARPQQEERSRPAANANAQGAACTSSDKRSLHMPTSVENLPALAAVLPCAHLHQGSAAPAPAYPVQHPPGLSRKVFAAVLDSLTYV